jgi:hypothetical protein
MITNDEDLLIRAASNRAANLEAIGLTTEAEKFRSLTRELFDLRAAGLDQPSRLRRWNAVLTALRALPNGLPTRLDPTVI